VRISLLALLLWLALPWLAVAATDTGIVTWVYDGDTLQVDKIGKVRLLGIDTPEYKASQRDRFYQREFGVAAARLRKISRSARLFVIEQVKGEQVVLEYDRQRQDKYGRILAYIYLADGSMLNRKLLQEGLATVYRRFDFSQRQQFLQDEAAARSAGSGIWAGARN